MTALNLFEQISTGSSLNPDTFNEDNNIICEFNQDFYIGDEINEDEEEEFGDEMYNGDQNEEEINNNEVEMRDDNNIYDESQRMKNQNVLNKEKLQPYNFTNSVDLIFRTEKKNRRELSDTDPRRFEDPDF